jgi:lysophospholipid acyltransferase (LPLAT)-like uncharacterized protein
MSAIYRCADRREFRVIYRRSDGVVFVLWQDQHLVEGLTAAEYKQLNAAISRRDDEPPGSFQRIAAA